LGADRPLAIATFPAEDAEAIPRRRARDAIPGRDPGRERRFRECGCAARVAGRQRRLGGPSQERNVGMVHGIVEGRGGRGGELDRELQVPKGVCARAGQLFG